VLYFVLAQKMDTNKILELFGYSVDYNNQIDWQAIIANQLCPFTKTKCLKVRKSQPDICIGSCAVRYGKKSKDIIICPNRLLERKQVFTDCLQLLKCHEPGNEFHIVSEMAIPGGSVDYFLISAKRGKVKDFVAIEFQTLDTTGTVWAERQRLVVELGLPSEQTINTPSNKSFGINWKMTAKTILVQLHHKIKTFEHINKYLVLIVQDHLLDYMKREFTFEHLNEPARLGDSMHIHSYGLGRFKNHRRIELDSRLSTDSEGVAICLGLQADAKVEINKIITELEKKISVETLFTLG
jgi:hypothetical protein